MDRLLVVSQSALLRNRKFGHRPPSHTHTHTHSRSSSPYFSSPQPCSPSLFSLVFRLERSSCSNCIMMLSVYTRQSGGDTGLGEWEGSVGRQRYRGKEQRDGATVECSLIISICLGFLFMELLYSPFPPPSLSVSLFSYPLQLRRVYRYTCTH